MMSDEKKPITLKVDPQELHRNKTAETLIKAEPAGSAVALKKNASPITIKTVSPINSGESDDAKSIEPQNNIRTQPRNQKKRICTKAEATYRKRIWLSIGILLLLLIILSLAATGAASFYLLRRVIAKPANGYLLRNTIFEIRNTPGISKKCQIIYQTWEKIRDKSSDNGKAPGKKSGGGTLNHIRNRSRAAENAAKNGVR